MKWTKFVLLAPLVAGLVACGSANISDESAKQAGNSPDPSQLDAFAQVLGGGKCGTGTKQTNLSQDTPYRATFTDAFSDAERLATTYRSSNCRDVAMLCPVGCGGVVTVCLVIPSAWAFSDGGYYGRVFVTAAYTCRDRTVIDSLND